MFGHSTAAKRAQAVAWILVACWAVILVTLTVTCVEFMYQLRYPPEGRVVEDPAADFTKYTGFPWPNSASLLLVGDDHGGWQGDGEFYLVFDVDREVLEEWLSKDPPWGEPQWQAGPIPGEISLHCGFGGSCEHVFALSSADLRYCAQDFQMASIPWHNGRLLAIDPVNCRVYLSWWDF